MSAVRCIGGQRWAEGNGAIVWSPPCGWTLAETAVAVTHRQALADEATAAAGRCPQCGGRVELSPSERQP
jgi:hypothetical protein